MPQLLPYYFVNQLSFGLLGLALVVYISARYLLPAVLSVHVTRAYITAL